MSENSTTPLGYAKLALDMVAVLSDKQYIIQGRIHWNMNYKEYYVSGEDSGYSTEFWVYDEWQLKDTDGDTIIYLIEDSEGYRISRAIEPEIRAFVGEQDGINHFTKFYRSHLESRVIEFGDSVVGFAEGMVQDDLKQGDRKYFFTYEFTKMFYSAEFKYEFNKAFYSAETPYDNLNVLLRNRTTYYQEYALSSTQLKKMFAGYPHIRKAVDGIQTLRILRNTSFLATFISLLMFVLSFVDSQIIYKETVDLSKLNDSIPYNTNTWKIDTKDQLYLYGMELKLKSYQGQITEVFVVMDMIDIKDSLKVGTMQGDFFEESGVDSEGKWTENNLYAYNYLTSDEVGGFYGQLYAEITPNKNTVGSIEIEVKKRWLLWYYLLPPFLLLSFITLILHVLLVQKDRTYSLSI